MKKKLKLGLHFFLFALLTFASVLAQQTQSGNGNGTYTNPVIYSDFPDPDIIRIDSTYYMVSAIMFIFLGVTILKSYDFVRGCSPAEKLRSNI